MHPSAHSWLACASACGVVTLAVLYDALDPLLIVSLVVFAVATRTIIFDKAEGFHAVSPDICLQTLGFDDDGPKPAYFAYPSSNRTHVLDLFHQSVFKDHGFVRAHDSVPTDSKWSGPPFDTCWSKDESSGIAVFVTAMIVDEEKFDKDLVDGRKASLFYAEVEEPQTVEADGPSTTTNVELSIQMDESVLKLVAQFGRKDTVEVLLPKPTGNRTYFFVRSATRLEAGYFDPDESYIEPDADNINLRTQSKEVAGKVEKGSNHSIRINYGNPVKIQSLALFKTAVKVDDMKKVADAINRHTMLHNGIHRKAVVTYETQRKVQLEKARTPLVKNIQGACPEVTDWTTFDPFLATPECLAAIAKSCQHDPKQPSCKCWDKADSMYNSPKCVTMRSLFYGQGAAPATSASNTNPPTTNTQAAEKGPPKSIKDAPSHLFRTPPSFWEYIFNPQ